SRRPLERVDQPLERMERPLEREGQPLKRKVPFASDNPFFSRLGRYRTDVTEARARPGDPAVRWRRGTMVYRNRTIPDTETGIRRFVYSFSRTIAADPAIYHLTPADADLLIAEADALIAASVTASRPITRTRPNIHA